MTAADLAAFARYSLPEQPDTLADARALIDFVRENGAPPINVSTARAERAIAVLITAIARRKDEHPATIAIVNRTIDHLAALARRNTAADAADAAARQEQQPDAPPDEDSTQPTDDQQRMIAGLTEVFTAALATAYERAAGIPGHAPSPGPRKTNGQQPDDPNQNNNGGPRVPRRPIAPTQPPAASFTTF